MSPHPDGAHRYAEAKRLFLEACGLEPECRAAFLSELAARDPDLAGRVQTLLAHYSEMKDARSLASLGDGSSQVHGRDQIGPFRLMAELGRGGQGVVYVAEDTRIHRRVALKVLRGVAPLDGKALRRFKREAEAASRVNHPSVCTIYEAEADHGIPYIAMRLIDGESVAKKLARGRSDESESISTCVNLDLEAAPAPAGQGSSESPKTPPPRSDINRVVLLIERAAMALHAAHEAGVIHRDIKPANIMVTPSDEPVITDFGLAHMAEGDGASITLSGDLFGTPAYMSPEQIAAQRIDMDRRTDIWSLGVTLYECLTLHRAFEGQSRDKLYQAILTKEPRDIRRLNPAVSEPLRSVIAMAMAKDRDLRYQTALEFAEDLRRVRENQPVRARGARKGGFWGLSWLERLIRFSSLARFLPTRASQRAFPFLVLLVTVGMTIGLTSLLRNVIEYSEKRFFEQSVDGGKQEVERRVGAPVGILLAVSSLSMADQASYRSAFQDFLSHANMQSPGIQSIGLCERVPEKERHQVKKRLEKDYGPPILLQPEDPPRAEWYPIVHVEPLLPNRWALGWDLFTERRVRSPAMERARDSGKPSATRRVAQPGRQTLEPGDPGFFVFMPVYKEGAPTATPSERQAAIQGFTYCWFRLTDLFNGILGSENKPPIVFRVYDSPDVRAEDLVYSPETETPGYPPRLTARRTIEVYGVPWTIEFFTQPEFDRTFSRWLVPYVFFGGVAWSLLLFFATFALVHARMDAERVTKILRERGWDPDE